MKSATTPHDLSQQFSAIAACAAITPAELQKDLGIKVACLKRVGTPASLELARIICKAESQALSRPNPLTQKIALAELVTWSGAIKIGWV